MSFVWVPIKIKFLLLWIRMKKTSIFYVQLQLQLKLSLSFAGIRTGGSCRFSGRPLFWVLSVSVAVLSGRCRCCSHPDCVNCTAHPDPVTVLSTDVLWSAWLKCSIRIPCAVLPIRILVSLCPDVMVWPDLEIMWITRIPCAVQLTWVEYPTAPVVLQFCWCSFEAPAVLQLPWQLCSSGSFVALLV